MQLFRGSVLFIMFIGLIFFNVQQLIQFKYQCSFIVRIIINLVQLQNKMAQRLTQIQDQLLFNQNQNLIVKYRRQYPLNQNQLKNLIYQEKYAKIRDQCFDVIKQNLHIFSHADIEEYSRKQEREKAVKMMLTYHELRPVKAIQIKKDPHGLSITAHALYNYDPGLSVKTDISIILYGKTLMNYGREENQIHKMLVQRCLKLQDIGCFGLTQLGHGSNVKGIQTEAIYDPKTKQFIINSPTTGSMKFWIGAAAQLANISAIWAQLIVNGKKYGPHPFIVPIRNTNTLQTLPGIIIGDCGHKNGCNNIDNGYIILKDVRIPKTYALDRFSGVNQNDQFWSTIQNPEKRFGLYMNPLSVGRAFISANSLTAAASALAIALRYTATRRQFTGPKQNQQRIILTYQLTKFRIMPLLATELVYFFGGLNILRLYDTNMKQLVNPNNKLITQMHAISGVTKAKSSWFASQTISQCRQLLGGHGYSAFSRLGRLFNDQDINTTWEGDNHMLLQQTVKYILKSASKFQRGKGNTDSMLKFLQNEINLPQTFAKQDLDSIELLGLILKKRISNLVSQIFDYMFKLKGQNFKDMDIWNYAQPYLGKKLAFAFGDLYYFNIITQKLPQMSKQLKLVCENSIRLWAFDILEKERWGTRDIRKILQQRILQLCQWMTPRSISLIDILAAPSQIIDSPFSDQKGQGMKKYINLLYTSKDTFKRVDWYSDLINLKQSQK